MNLTAVLFLFSVLGNNGGRVLYATQDSLVLYWKLPPVDTERVKIKGKEFLSIQGGEPYLKPGEPNLPSYTIWLAIPPGCEPEVDIVETRERSFSKGVDVLPVPHFKDDGLTPVYRKQSAEKVNRGSYDFLKGPFVTYVRHQRAMYMVLNPFQYIPETKEVKVVEEAKIKVKFRKVKDEPPFHGTDPFEDLYRARFLNYKQGKSWRVQGVRLEWTNPFEGSDLWVKIQFLNPGLYEITGKELENLGIPMGISSNSLRMFTLGADTLPSPIDQATKSMKEVSIKVEDGGDGKFDSNDRIIFYGMSTTVRNWMGNGFLYYSNPYQDTCVYWLGIFSVGNGLRMEDRNVSPDFFEGPPLSECVGYFRHEKNLYNIGRKGIRWEGEYILRNPNSFTAETTFTFDLEDLVGDSGQLTVDIVGGTDRLRYTEITLNDSVLDTVFIDGLRNSRLIFFPKNLKTQGNTLKLKIIAFSDDLSKLDYLYLDYFEVSYSKRLAYSHGDEKVYFGSGTNGLFSLLFQGNLPSYMLDISDLFSPVMLKGAVSTGSEFGFVDSIYGGKRYFFTDKVKSPIRISLKSSFTARVPHPADMVVITPREFSYVISSWVAYKRENLFKFTGENWEKVGGEVLVMPIEEIFDAFGYGYRDPVSIRNFLKFQSDVNGDMPTYLLLLGDGHYDYKGFITSSGNLVPPYEPFEVYDVNTEVEGAVDDFYGDMDWTGHGTLTADIYIGRIPVRTTNQATVYFRKSIRYENGDANGPWRNRVLFVADDEFTSEGGVGETFHTASANQLYVSHTPPTIEADKVYLIEFMPVSERGRLGHDALIRAYNRGALIAVGFMHGNPVTMTHEHIFQAPLDYSFINAGPRNPLWIIASCKISAFDRLNPPAVIGEDWTLRDGGAIGVISSTTLSYPTYNITFTKNIFDQLIDYSVVPLGALCLDSKSVDVDKYYILLGDPSIPFSYPQPGINIDIEGVKPGGGLVKDTLFLSYEAHYGANGVQSSRVFIRSFEREKDTTYHGPTVSITYRWIPRAYFSGTAIRTAGDSVKGKFFVPFNIEPTDTAFYIEKVRSKPIGKVGVDLKSSISKILLPEHFGASVIVYDPTGQMGLVGVAKPIWIKRAEYSPFDTTGPGVRLIYKGKEIGDSSFVPSDVKLKLEVWDTHGINTTTDLPGGEKGLVYILDQGEPVYLGHGFEYYSETDTIGSALLDLSLGSGRHELRIKAYDNLGNYTDKKFTLITVAESELKLWDLLVYPNPVRSKGPVWFTFKLNREAKVQVKVFTVAGRMVWKSSKINAGTGFNRVFWDGKDMDGDEISNGLYLVKVTATTEGKEETSLVEKMLIAR